LDKSTAVKEEFGKDRAKAEKELYKKEGDELESKRTNVAKELEKLKARRIGRGVKVETSEKLSPDPTPNRPIPLLKRGKV
jgi:hypothetical protein